MKIAVCHTDIVASTTHEVEQGDRIASTADGEEHPLPFGDKVLLANVVYETFEIDER